MDDLHFRFNQKGRRNLTISKQRGGGNKRGDSNESVKVLATMDRENNMILDVVRIGRLKAKDIFKSVGCIINPQTNILTSDKHPCIKSFAKQNGIIHETFKAKKHSRNKIYHVNTVNSKASILSNLIKDRFKGVNIVYNIL